MKHSTIRLNIITLHIDINLEIHLQNIPQLKIYIYININIHIGSRWKVHLITDFVPTWEEFSCNTVRSRYILDGNWGVATLVDLNVPGPYMNCSSRTKSTITAYTHTHNNTFTLPFKLAIHTRCLFNTYSYKYI